MIKLIVVILLVIGFMLLIYTDLSKESKFYADKLDKEWNWESTIGYKSIDETHYNCCWDEVELTDDGYYTNRKCRGFER